jgi:putative hydrolase of the HAD superfamily
VTRTTEDAPREGLNIAAGFLYTLAGLNTPISTVILDFGGVLGLPQDPVRAQNMASLCGLSMDQFSRLYLRDRLEFDRGTLSTEEYWSRILRASGKEPIADLVIRMEHEDSLGWTRINPRMVQWSRELRAAGYRTAILSNMPGDKLLFMRKDPAFDWMAEFPVTVFSCDYRLVKPEPEIYATCLQLLGKKAGECLFLDDAPVNVEGGRSVGMPAMLFRGAEEAARELSDTWGLPVRSLVNGSGN